MALDECTIGSHGKSRAGQSICLRHHPNWIMLAPGDHVKVYATAVGTTRYNGQTIHGYDFASGPSQ